MGGKQAFPGAVQPDGLDVAGGLDQTGVSIPLGDSLQQAGTQGVSLLRPQQQGRRTQTAVPVDLCPGADGLQRAEQLAGQGKYVSHFNTTIFKLDP